MDRGEGASYILEFGFDSLTIPVQNLLGLKLRNFGYLVYAIAVVGMATVFSGLIPYNPNIKYATIGFLLVLVLAVYIHVYNLWMTMRRWKGSPGEKFARNQQASARNG